MLIVGIRAEYIHSSNYCRHRNISNLLHLGIPHQWPKMFIGLSLFGLKQAFALCLEVKSMTWNYHQFPLFPLWFRFTYIIEAYLANTRVVLNKRTYVVTKFKHLMDAVWVTLKNIFASNQSYSVSAGVKLVVLSLGTSCMAMGTNSPYDVEWNNPRQLGATNSPVVNGILFFMTGPR